MYPHHLLPEATKETARATPLSLWAFVRVIWTLGYLLLREEYQRIQLSRELAEVVNDAVTGEGR